LPAAEAVASDLSHISRRRREPPVPARDGERPALLARPPARALGCRENLWRGENESISTGSSAQRCSRVSHLVPFVLRRHLPERGRGRGGVSGRVTARRRQGGFTYGYSVDNETTPRARDKALNACRTTKDAAKSAKLCRYCKVIEVFSRKCVAVAMDPAPGTPVIGWAVAEDLRTAEQEALSRCEDTARRGRRAACVVDHSGCDEKP
jgi:hypothetical protein